VTEAVAAGWEALARGAWSEALGLLEDADGDPEALEGVGLACWWLDDADATIEARERAYRLYRERDDALGAARVAGALAWDSVLFGGRVAVARGWLDRARRLLADVEPTPEHAWLAVREAEVALAAGEPVVTREAAARAVALGGEVGSEEVQVIGRSLDGLALVHEGSIDEGMRQLDESAVAARAGDVKDMAWVGKVCCNLISACERVGDVDRATEWCEEVKEYAQRWELQALFNVCRTQYGAILLQRGAWQEAERELQTALAVFQGGRRAALFEGMARLGELRRRQGRLDEARALFADSERSWVSRLGLVQLSLDEDDPETAFAAADRLARATEPDKPLDRIAVLALVVRAAVATDRLDAATDAADELDALAAEVGTARARADAASASGEVAVATGNLAQACRWFEDAIDLLAGAPYERARARLALAGVLIRLGQEQRARSEATAAREAFVALDARREVAAANELLDAPGQSPLTRREHEVLALVAVGRSNREIASELVLSEHTVHRHVANILRKLDEPTRAAAAARAARDKLI
jgi:ATP/maltotriose-dependent transcriptional regulator MalT